MGRSNVLALSQKAEGRKQMRMREIKRELKKEQHILDAIKNIIAIVEGFPADKRLRIVKAAAILAGIDL